MPCARSPTLEALAKPKVSPPPRCSNASAMRARVVECLSPIRGQRHRWWRRASTDLRVLQHANREYGKMLRRLPHAEAVRTVLDAGANAGFSSSLFASLLPRVATVLAVEPNVQNHAMLALNTAGHSTVLPLRAAVWGRDEPMRVDDGARKSRVANNVQWSYVTLPRPAHHEPSSSDVDGVSVPTILRWACLDQFDFAKLDIEGSEWQVLSGDTASWLRATRYVYLEAHDDVGRFHNRERTGLVALHEQGFSILAVFPSGYRFDRVYLGCNTRFLSASACEAFCINWKNDSAAAAGLFCRRFNHTAAILGRNRFLATGPPGG